MQKASAGTFGGENPSVKAESIIQGNKKVDDPAGAVELPGEKGQDELRRKSDKNGVVGSGKGKKQPQIYMTQTEKIGFFVGTDDAAGGGVLL